MAKNRSRRLRKKMHIDEFRGIRIFRWHGDSRKVHRKNRLIKPLMIFINEVIEPNKLAFDGSGYLAREGLICMQEIGKCTEEHQAIVRKWLEERKLDEVRTSELFDVWWD
ncbi:50S ribosome-binding protein YggL [Escherichia coli]